jgi:hypothetical protein
MATGYSATPLYKKLGLKRQFSVLLIHPPENYGDLIREIKEELVFRSIQSANLDFIHLFTNSIPELEERLPKLKMHIKQNGMIWISWYKKSSARTSALSENIIRNTALALGLVDVKVCAVDDQWSGLKLVIPVSDRKK